MLATEYATYYDDIEAQQQGESDLEFRERVAGELRNMGHIIEAHEAQADERYEESDQVMTGIIGAVAQALQSVDYGKSGIGQVGDDVAAGHFVQNPPSKIDPDMAMLMLLLFK